MLNSFKPRRSVRLVELQSLIGTLQFACKVVVPSRTFLQWVINLTRGVPSRFHHIRLNKEFFRDLDMWKVFLANWNGRSFFLESFPTPSADLELYTDAAGSIGFGGYLQGKRFQGHWPPHMCLNWEQGISIEWQELFPIVVACSIWHPFLVGKRLKFWCDNESVVSIINFGHSKVPRITELVRKLVLLSMQHNFLVRAHPWGLKWGSWCTLLLSDAVLLGPHSGRRPESLYHPAFTNEPLRDEVLNYAGWGLAKNTTRAYNCGEKRFLEFYLMNHLLGLDGDVLPASEGTLVYFASYLARTVRHSTIEPLLSSSL